MNTQLFSCGWNEYGQCCQKEKKDYFKPFVADVGHLKIKKIICGSFTGAIIDSNSRVYMFGSQTVVEGHPKKQCHEPVLIPQLSNIVDVAIGIGHHLFLRRDGLLYTSGKSDHGQTTFGSSLVVPTVPKFFRDKVISKIYAFDTCSFVIEKFSNKVYVMGYCNLLNSNKNKEIRCYTPEEIEPCMFQGNDQMDDGECVRTIRMKNDTLILLTNKGRVYGSGSVNTSGVGSQMEKTKNLTLFRYLSEHRIIDVAVSPDDMFLFLTEKGHVYALGTNKYPTLTRISSPDAVIVAMPSNCSHGMFLSQTGNVRGFGSGSLGRLGNAPEANSRGSNEEPEKALQSIESHPVVQCALDVQCGSSFTLFHTGKDIKLSLPSLNYESEQHSRRMGRTMLSCSHLFDISILTI